MKQRGSVIVVRARCKQQKQIHGDPEITSINKLERDTLALKMLLISGYPLPVYRGAIAGFIPLVPKPVFCVAILPPSIYIYIYRPHP